MENKVREIVADILDLEISEVKDEALILDDLGADSIAVMEIVMELEDEFDIEVSTDDILTLTTTADIITYIENNQ